MSPTKVPQVEHPLGRLFSQMGKDYLHLLRAKLQHLDIDRYYYSLILIGNHGGEITQNELAQLLETDKVSVVRMIDYLAEKGYVQRVRKTNDRRKHNLLLTEKAMLALPEITNSIAEMNSMALSRLSVSEQTTLCEIIIKIKKNITENTISL